MKRFGRLGSNQSNGPSPLPKLLQNQLNTTKRTKRKLKKFKDRNKERFTQKELKVINMRFDNLTNDIVDGNLDIREFEEKRISRKLEQNFNVYEYDSRLRNRLEQLMLQLEDKKNLFFPWNFNQDHEPEEEKNLKACFPFQAYLTPEKIDEIFKKFIVGLINKDYVRMRKISEPAMVKRIRVNFKKMDDIEVKCENLETAEYEYDLYNVKNYFVVDVDQNRRKNFFFDKCKIFTENIDGVDVEHFIPKRLGRKPTAKLITQFELNLKTDLDLKLVKDDTVYKEDKNVVEGSGYSYHKLKLELIVAEAGFKALLNSKENEEIGSFMNLLENEEFRIIDFDGFMKGNPILKGL